MRSCLRATEGRFRSLFVPPPSPETALAVSPNDGLRQTGPCFARVGHRRSTRVSTDLVSFPSIPTSPPFRRPSDRRQSPKVWHPKRSPSTCSGASLSSARARGAAALIEGARRRADRDSLSLPDRYYARGAVAGCVPAAAVTGRRARWLLRHGWSSLPRCASGSRDSSQSAVTCWRESS